MAELPPSCALWLVITAGTTTPAAWSDGQSRPAEDHLQRGGRLPHGGGCRCVVAPAGSPDRGRNARLGHRHMPMRPSTAATKVAAWQAANAGTTGLRWVAVRRFFAKEALPVATAPLRASTVPVMPPATPAVPTSGRHSVRRPADAVRAALGVGGTGLLLSGRRAKGQPATQGACSTPTQLRPPTAWRRTVGTATPSHCPPSGVLELPTSGARFVMLEVAGAQAEKNRLSPSG
jgi:hypothetical protein